jgi:hypothetical protein
MILSIHNLAENYKCLPTEVLERATTFDLYVLDVHTRWVKYQHEQAMAKQEGRVTPLRAPKLTEQQMLDMIKRTRSGNESKVRSSI